MRISHIPCSEDNYAYLIVDEGTKEAAAVDPVEPEKVLQAAREAGVDLKLVLTTHRHWQSAVQFSRRSLKGSKEDEGRLESLMQTPFFVYVEGYCNVELH